MRRDTTSPSGDRLPPVHLLPAWALSAEEACVSDAGVGETLAHAEAAEAGLRRADSAVFLTESDALQRSLPCLRERLSATDVFRAARVIAARAWVGRRDDPDGVGFAVEGLALAARAAGVPEQDVLPTDLFPASHGLRAALAARTGSDDDGPWEERRLPSVCGWTLLVGGVPARELPAGATSVVQVIRAGEVIDTVVARPDQPLPGVLGLARDVECTEAEPPLAVDPHARSRHTLLVGLATAAVVGSGALYGVSAWADARFEADAANPGRFAHVGADQNLTNGATLLSVGAAVTAVGLGIAATVTW